MQNHLNQKRHKLLFGLTEEQSNALAQGLSRRALVPRDVRGQYPMPAGLKGTWIGCWWWALASEWQDRPLLTLLGVLAVVSYPVVWICLRQYH
jgi:hypothetical protein